MTVEILRISEGYVTTTICTLMLQNGLLVQVTPKEELNVCLKCFYMSARKKDSTYYKSSSMKSIRAAIDRFLCLPRHNKPFSIISDPAFTEANKVLYASEKGKNSWCRPQKSNLERAGEETIWEPLTQADSFNPAQLQRTAWFYRGLFFGRRERENQWQSTLAMLSLQKTPQGQ